MSDETKLALEVDVLTVAAWMDEAQDFVLIDVREPEEDELARIHGAKLIPMSQFRERIEELEPLRERHLVIHCHHGGRSLRVTEALRSQGFAKVQNMAGGIDDWSQRVDSSVPRY